MQAAAAAPPSTTDGATDGDDAGPAGGSRPARQTSTASAATLANPHAHAAPFRTGVRQAVSADRADLLLKLFQAIDPHFDPDSTASNDVGGGVRRLSRCEYEDSGQSRMFYAMQKQCRYCLRQGRQHSKTFGQLYVTYGSVKFRCYSNDCHDACHVVPWTPETLPIRDALFPNLSTAELCRRYPHMANLLLAADSAAAITAGAATNTAAASPGRHADDDGGAAHVDDGGSDDDAVAVRVAAAMDRE